jgi:preprotein translocase subunit SecB
VTSNGGFPPFMLEPIDFSAVYASQQIQRENGTVLGGPGATTFGNA